MTGDAIGKYTRLQEASEHFMHDAFRSMHEAAQHEVAGLLFGPLLDDIEAPEGWVVPPMAEGLQGFVDDGPDVLPDETISEMAEAWRQAQVAASASTTKLEADHNIKSISLASHAINLAAAVEILVNRELFLRQEVAGLPRHHFKHLDRAPVMTKVIFLFTDEAASGGIDVGQLAALFTLRNAAVHLGANQTSRLSRTPQQLSHLWAAVAQLVDQVSGPPSRLHFDGYVAEVTNRWFGTMTREKPAV